MGGLAATPYPAATGKEERLGGSPTSQFGESRAGPSASSPPRGVYIRGSGGWVSEGTSGSSKNETRRYRDRHLSQGQQQGIGTVQARDPVLNRGNLCLSFSSDHVASVTAQHEAETSHSAASSATLASSNVGCALRAQKLCFGGVSGNAAPRRNRKRGAPGRLPNKPTWQVESRPGSVLPPRGVYIRGSGGWVSKRTSGSSKKRKAVQRPPPQPGTTTRNWHSSRARDPVWVQNLIVVEPGKPLPVILF